MPACQERARQEKADRLALEQVGTLAARMHRQLFLQLHHVMDEACGLGHLTQLALHTMDIVMQGLSSQAVAVPSRCFGLLPIDR